MVILKQIYCFLSLFFVGFNHLPLSSRKYCKPYINISTSPSGSHISFFSFYLFCVVLPLSATIVSIRSNLQLCVNVEVGSVGRGVGEGETYPGKQQRQEQLQTFSPHTRVPSHGCSCLAALTVVPAVRQREQQRLDLTK